MTLWDENLLVGEADLATHTGFILAEDAALKQYLQGLKVPVRDGDDLDVDVYFRYPESERRTKFPFLTIDLIDAAPAVERWTSEWKVGTTDASFRHPVTGVELSRGMYVPSTSPELPPVPDGSSVHIDPYLAFKLTYQVTLHSRSALHDRLLWSRLMTDVFPPRPWFIGVDADNTWRRCELVDVQQADTAETSESGSKRNFRKVFTITMEAEVPQSKIAQVFQVLRVHGDIYDDATTSREAPDHPYDGPHTEADSSFTVEPPPGP